MYTLSSLFSYPKSHFTLIWAPGVIEALFCTCPYCIGEKVQSVAGGEGRLLFMFMDVQGAGAFQDDNGSHNAMSEIIKPTNKGITHLYSGHLWSIKYSP